MEKVYVVHKRHYRTYANCEPLVSKIFMKAFDSFDKAVTYVEDRFTKDHERINDSDLNLNSWRKCYLQRDMVSNNGIYHISVEYEDGHAYDSIAYNIESYDVE